MQAGNRSRRRRRIALTTAAILAVAAIATGVALATGAIGDAADTVAFHGPHQAGIATPQRQFAFVAAFDVTTTDAAELRHLLEVWTEQSANLTAGRPAAPTGAGNTAPGSTGEAWGFDPAGLTVTFGVGPELFDGRFGLATQRPDAFSPLPEFPGDQLQERWTGGDLVVQTSSDDFQIAFNAIHNLSRAAKGYAVLRWVQQGFLPGPEANPHGDTGRNLEGFRDGTANPDIDDPEVMDSVVWIGDDGPEWARGGSYLVMRRIRMLVEVWDRSSLDDQEQTIGRHKESGAPLGGSDEHEELEPGTLPENSHVRLARGDGTTEMLRRGYNYVEGLDPRTGQWNAGLVFLAFMKDPATQFVPVQMRLSSMDALNEYIRTVGSGVYLMLAGARDGSYVGSGLLPPPTERAAIEAVQARLGRLAAAARSGAGSARLEELFHAADNAWRSANREVAFPADLVSAMETGLSQLGAAIGGEATTAGGDATAAGGGTTTAAGNLVALLQARADELGAASNPASGADGIPALAAAVERARERLASGDAPAAAEAYGEFVALWPTAEGAVRSASVAAYREIEQNLAAPRIALASNPPDVPRAERSLDAISQRLATIGVGVGDVGGRVDGGGASRAGFGAVDVMILVFREGLEALIVLAVLLGFLRRARHPEKSPWIWGGAGAGLLLSIAGAVAVTAAVDTWSGFFAQETMEGVTGLIAVALMLTIGIWMHHKTVVRNWNLFLHRKVGDLLSNGRMVSLAALAGLAVLREGAETIVFLWGVAGSIPVSALLEGFLLAGGVLVAIGFVILRLSRRLPLVWLLRGSTALIYYMAVKIAGQSLVSLQASGVLPATPLSVPAVLSGIGVASSSLAAAVQMVLFAVVAILVVHPFVAARRRAADARA